MKRHATTGCTAVPTITATGLLDASPGTSRAWGDDPELRLRAAVLLDAVDVILRGPERCSRVFIDARNWIASDDESWPFSCRRICEALGVDVDRLRRGLEPHFAVLRPAYRGPWPGLRLVAGGIDTFPMASISHGCSVPARRVPF